MAFFNTFLLVVRPDRPVRRLVHHLQLLLDPRRPAQQGDGAAAGHRRQPAPGARLGAARGGRRRAHRLGRRPRRRHRRGRRAEGAARRDGHRHPRRRRRRHAPTPSSSRWSPASASASPRRCFPARRAAEGAAGRRHARRRRRQLGQQPHAGSSSAPCVTGLGAAAIAAGLFGGGGARPGRPRRARSCSSASPCSVRSSPGRSAGCSAAPLARVRGMAGTLARENAMRNPKRTSATAAALMIGVALVGFITILASSTKASVDDTRRRDASPATSWSTPARSAGRRAQPARWPPSSRALPEVERGHRPPAGAGRGRRLRHDARRRRSGAAAPDRRPRRHRRRRSTTSATSEIAVHDDTADEPRAGRSATPSRCGSPRPACSSSPSAAIYDDADLAGDVPHRPRAPTTPTSPTSFDYQVFVSLRRRRRAAEAAGRRSTEVTDAVPAGRGAGPGRVQGRARARRSTCCSTSSTPCSPWP